MKPLFFLVFGVLGVLLVGCWDESQSHPNTPEECKVTTNPEACRKAYQR